MDEDLGFRIEIRSIETSERTSLELRLGRTKKHYREVDCDALSSIEKEFK